MNKVILIGRLTRDPEIRYTENDNPISNYTLAVERRYHRDGEQSVDFINCKAFGKSAEFAIKYLIKGIKIAVSGRIQTGSYTNKEGRKVYTTEIIIEDQEFVESKANANTSEKENKKESYADGFMNVPDNDLDDLPFN